MKGFPNQISNLSKLATGIRVLIELVDSGQDAKDDGRFGSELVRQGVAGTGHSPMPIEEYLAQQEQRSPSQQSHRTTARGLRELYRMLGFIDDGGPSLTVLPLGRQAATLTDETDNDAFKHFWRGAFWGLCHQSGDERSHPYQVLLRLLAQQPTMSRAKCALALEAEDDSSGELLRISALADRTEDEILATIDVTPTTWTNARKILPAVAIQLGDVRRVQSQKLELAHVASGVAKQGPPSLAEPTTGTGRQSRRVTPETIARLRSDAEFDESPAMIGSSPADAAHTALLRLHRLQRHQAIVQRLAVLLEGIGAELHEDPFDVLAVFDDSAVVFEVKTLGGDQADERERVREALAQLCYYETFNVGLVTKQPKCHKVACFERPISDEHRQFLQQQGILVIWQFDEFFDGDSLPGDLTLGGTGEA